MENIQVDVLVIGSGPAGQKAAIAASKLKKSVAVIENEGFLGGACLHSGTIPSKTLRAAILDLTEFYQKSFYSEQPPLEEISINELNYRLKYVKELEETIVKRQFEKNRVSILSGSAEFEDPHIVKVLDESNQVKMRVKAEKIIIASGSRPRNPENVPFDHKRVLDSSTLLKIEQIPKTMMVLGGGVIGSEYASFFAALGSQVTLLDKKDHMLPYLDREIGIHLQDGLSQIGLKFYGKKCPSKIEVVADKVKVLCDDGSEYESDCLLYALGREANVSHLNLSSVGIQTNHRGYVEVSPFFQTSQPHVYAVGDVIGGASLASTSMEQGRLAALKACGEKTHLFPEVFPLGIYTIPEISCCGMTEEEVKKKKFRYEVGRAYYYEMAAAHIYGSNNIGMVKIIFHADTLEILGVHIVGRNASEVIHIGQVAMMHRSKIDFFVSQVFNYPTFAEGYRIAALNGLNKLNIRIDH